MSIYFWGAGGGERWEQRIQSRHCANGREPNWAQTHKLHDQNLSRSRTLNQLSHQAPQDEINFNNILFNSIYWGTWAAQLVKHRTLDLSSGHGLTVGEFKPHIELCADSTEPACDSVSPSLCSPPHPIARLSPNKLILKTQYIKI